MLEYLNAPDATAVKFLGDWFLTGDSASMSETGAFTYEGRSDDIMNAGGYRVSPDRGRIRHGPTSRHQRSRLR